jgi:Kef-type K+ transport system membrane component KefB
VDDLHLLRSVGLIVIAGTIFALGARLIRMPSIVAYIGAGLLLGPLTGWLEVTRVTELIAESGIALLLFLVGLELSFDKIRDVGKVALWAGLGQVLFTAAGGVGLCLLLGYELIEALFLATALTFSSTVVVVKLLDQKGELDSLYGRIAVGIFLVQDLVVIIVLTVLAGLGSAKSLEPLQVAKQLGAAFGGMAVLLAVALLASRYALRRPFAWAARSSEMLLVWSLCWCFSFVLAAEVMGLSLEVGAFLAGISLAQLPYHLELRRRVHPLMSFFIAVFFVSLGVQMQLGAGLSQVVQVLVLSLFVLLGNPLIFIIIIARFGYSERTTFLTSVTVAQISEFSFIFASMGVGAGLIGADLLSVVAWVGLVTIAVSAYMILYNHKLYAWVRKLGLLRVFGAAQTEDEAPPSRRSGHVIVIGMNPLGRQIAATLGEHGERVLAIDTDPRKLEGLACEILLGNAEHPSVLQEADLGAAKLLVSALQVEDVNNLLVHLGKRAKVPVAIHGFDRSVLDDLYALEVDYVIVPRKDALDAQQAVLERRLGAVVSEVRS